MIGNRERRKKLNKREEGRESFHLYQRLVSSSQFLEDVVHAWSFEGRGDKAAVDEGGHGRPLDPLQSSVRIRSLAWQAHVNEDDAKAIHVHLHRVKVQRLGLGSSINGVLDDGRGGER